MALFIGETKITDVSVGVTLSEGEVQSKEVSPSTEDIIVLPDEGFDALKSVTVKGDIDLKAENIKDGVELFGITGTYTGEPIHFQSKEISPSETATDIFPDAGYNGLSKVTVKGISQTYVGSKVPRVTAKTITPGTADKTAIDSGSYANGTITVLGDADLKSENIKTGVNIFGIDGSYSGEGFTLQEKSVNPTEQTQNVTADSTYNGLSKVIVNPISTTYVGSGVTRVNANVITPGTSEKTAAAANVYTNGIIKVAGDTDLVAKNIKSGVNIFGVDGNFTSNGTQSSGQTIAIADDILTGKSAWAKGVEVQGSMPNNGDVSNTITTQNGTCTIPAGYTSGGTIKAQLTPVALTNTIINGSSFQESTKDYGWRSTVEIPEGYHSAVTLTKDFSSMLPAPETEGAAAQLLTGYDLYNHDGQLINGSMVNNGKVTQTLNGTTTSYTIPAGYHNGTGTVSHATVNIPDPTITVSNAGLITASGNWTAGFTTDTSYSKTQQLTTKAAATITPTNAEQTAVAAGTYTTGAIKVAAMPSGALSTPTINTSTGVVTSGVGTAGYIDTTATKTLNLTTQAAKTVTPTKSSQTAVAAQRYTTGAVTVAAIPDEYITTTDATATQSDIISGQTAYVKGNKITGNLVVQKYYTGSSAPSSTLGNDGDIYLQS